MGVSRIRLVTKRRKSLEEKLESIIKLEKQLIKDNERLESQKELLEERGLDPKHLSLIGDPRSYEMMESYRAGKTLEQIGSEYGYTREYIRQILTANGLTPRTFKREVKDSQKKEIVELIKKGKTLEEITKHTGFPRHLVRETALENDVEYETDKERSHRERDEQIITLYKSGLTQKQIAEKLGTVQTNVSRVLIKHGKNKPQTSVDEVMRLHNDGYSNQEISIKLKTSEANVSRIIRKCKEEIK